MQNTCLDKAAISGQIRNVYSACRTAKEIRELQRDAEAMQKENEELRGDTWKAIMAEAEAKDKLRKAEVIIKHMKSQVGAHNHTQNLSQIRRSISY